MTKRENENVRWVMGNLVLLLPFFFLLKDFCAIRYLASQKVGLEATFIARLVMLPGSLLFWGFAAWAAIVFNILCGALVGWTASRIFQRV